MIRVRQISRLFVALGLIVVAASMELPNRAEAFEHFIRIIVADESVPTCEQGAVVDTIRSKFGTNDANVLKAGIALGTIDKITQAYYGMNDPSPYVRRYCEARTTLSNGKTAKLYYLVEQEAGFAGVTWNVEACVLGYEPWFVHDGRCHTVRHRWW